MSSINNQKVLELLHKSWMTHDAMWFFHCIQEFGIEKANKLNQAAVMSMAMIEIKRIRKFLGMKHQEIESFEVLKELITGAYDILKPDFFNFTFDFPDANVLNIRWSDCFVCEGVKKIGEIDNYQCAVFTRLKGWFESLELNYIMTPDVNTCIAPDKGDCIVNFRFDF